MPKKVFWPATLVVMGFILLASNLGVLPPTFWELWPLILIVVGLGGLITADREQWLVSVQRSGDVSQDGASQTKVKSESKSKPDSKSEPSSASDSETDSGSESKKESTKKKKKGKKNKSKKDK
jgi:hypothetical protein